MTNSAAEPGSATRPKLRRPGLSSALTLAVLLFGCVAARCTTPGADEPTDGLFARYELLTGIHGRQTVLPGFFLGGDTAEIAVVGIAERGTRRLRMYGFDGGAWALQHEATLGPEVLFIDVVEAGDRDRLITYAPGRLSWFDPDAGTERPLLEVAMDYDPRHDLEGTPILPGGRPPQVDITRDLNHDGRDDLVMPAVDGFWVSIQRSDGSFADVVKLGPPEPFRHEPVGRLDVGDGGSGGARSYGDVGITASTLPLYLGRVHEMDYDQDGLSDLVFWNEDRFEAHLQGDDGLFAPQAESFTTDVAFDSEGIYSHAFAFRDRGVMSLLFGFGKKAERKVLHSVRDLDGDGVADLLTLTLSGRSFLKQRSVYEVHFGTATARGTVFERQAGAVMHPRGRAGAMQPWGYSDQSLQDVDGDGRLDLLLQDVNVGLGGMMRALVGNRVGIDLELYQAEGGAYPERATIRRRIRGFAPFAGFGNVFFPSVLMGDVDGDGLSDLLVGKGARELRVYLGEPGPVMLARAPRKVAVALPQDERRTRLVDLNRDGKRDVLVHLAPTARDPERPHQLTLLVAR